jgi:mono/diheme cytochrome c family protein
MTTRRRGRDALYMMLLVGGVLATACGVAQPNSRATVKSAVTRPVTDSAAATLATSLATIATQDTGGAARHPSTLDGVYTAEQAKRGKDVYFGNCRSCHSAATHTGATFAQWWQGKQLSDLFLYVATKMPKNDPGSLAPEDAADVVAYLLQLNAMPTGKAELLPDPDALAKYRIEVK